MKYSLSLMISITALVFSLNDTLPEKVYAKVFGSAQPLNGHKIVVSFYELISSGNELVGEEVLVSGVIIRHQKNYPVLLYADKKMAELGVVVNSIQLQSFEESCQASLSSFNGRYVSLSGKVSSGGGRALLDVSGIRTFADGQLPTKKIC
ncbi:hypothetical protein ABFZ85_14850 [Hyphococcus formosus]|uniref:hypothetical protein n=1 Tax=Hyphococcus formosus TaxID=3143534 RepID=UPI00398B319A